MLHLTRTRSSAPACTGAPRPRKPRRILRLSWEGQCRRSRARASWRNELRATKGSRRGRDLRPALITIDESFTYNKLFM